MKVINGFKKVKNYFFILAVIVSMVSLFGYSVNTMSAENDDEPTPADNLEGVVFWSLN